MALPKNQLSSQKTTMYLIDPTEGCIIVGLDTQHKEGEHDLWDARIHLPLDRALVANIKAFGVKEPVLARRNGDDVEIVDGRQRIRAARQANKELEKEGKELIQVRAIPENDEDILGVMISVNKNRQNIEGPMENARLLGRYLATGKTDSQAANAFGVTTTAIRDWKKMLGLAPEVQEAIDNKSISATSAKEMFDLSREEQVIELHRRLGTEPPAADATDGKKKGKSKKGADASSSDGASAAPAAETAGAGKGDKKKKKPTAKAMQQARQKRQGSAAAVTYTPPKQAVLRKVAELPEAKSKLSAETMGLLRYVTGLSDGSDIPEIVALIEATPSRGKAKPAAEKPAYTAQQQQVLDTIEECKGEVLASQVRKTAVDKLVTMGVVIRVKGDDGLDYVRKAPAADPAMAGGEAAVA